MNDAATKTDRSFLTKKADGATKSITDESLVVHLSSEITASSPSPQSIEADRQRLMPPVFD